MFHNHPNGCHQTNRSNRSQQKNKNSSTVWAPARKATFGAWWAEAAASVTVWAHARIATFGAWWAAAAASAPKTPWQLVTAGDGGRLWASDRRHLEELLLGRRDTSRSSYVDLWREAEGISPWSWLSASFLRLHHGNLEGHGPARPWLSASVQGPGARTCSLRASRSPRLRWETPRLL